HNVVLWRGLAEVVEKYVKKGDMIYIEGKLRTRSWEKDGMTRYTTEVIGDNMTMLGGNSGGGMQGTQSPSMDGSSESPPMDDTTDDLPF
ncbi:MAG: single-stranded DNA-binding protein, partial [Bacteroidota bacterium]